MRGEWFAWRSISNSDFKTFGIHSTNHPLNIKLTRRYFFVPRNSVFRIVRTIFGSKGGTEELSMGEMRCSVQIWTLDTLKRSPQRFSPSKTWTCEQNVLHVSIGIQISQTHLKSIRRKTSELFDLFMHQAHAISTISGSVFRRGWEINYAQMRSTLQLFRIVPFVILNSAYRHIYHTHLHSSINYLFVVYFEQR